MPEFLLQDDLGLFSLMLNHLKHNKFSFVHFLGSFS
jgi:hypothetical protein